MENFSKEECEEIINTYSALKGKRANSSRTGIKSSTINYTSRVIENNSSTKWIFDKFDNHLQLTENLKVVKQLDIINFFHYHEGDQFSKHKDVYYTDQSFNVGVNLTDDYEGGEFKLFNPDITVGQKRGEIYSFYHTREHEITKITKGNRYSLIGFYYYNNTDQKRQLI